MEKERRNVIAKLSKWEKARRWIWRKFDRSITFDDIRELPDRFMYPIGGLVTFSYAFFFMGFAIYSFYNTVNAVYLAPIDDDGSGICNTVPNEIAGTTVLIDSNGNYEGNPAFSYVDAIYDLSLQRFVSSPSNYGQIMGQVKDAIQSVGNDAQNHTLAKNLLTWLTWRQTLADAHGNLQTFKFEADIGSVFTVFSSMGLGVTMQGRTNMCTVPSEAELIAYRMGFRFDTYGYNKNSDCSSLLNQHALMYSGNAPIIATTNVSYVSFDIRSFVVAAALHAGIFTDQTCNGDVSHCLEVVETLTKEEPTLVGGGYQET